MCVFGWRILRLKECTAFVPRLITGAAGTYMRKALTCIYKKCPAESLRAHKYGPCLGPAFIDLFLDQKLTFIGVDSMVLCFGMSGCVLYEGTLPCSVKIGRYLMCWREN